MTYRVRWGLALKASLCLWALGIEVSDKAFATEQQLTQLQQTLVIYRLLRQRPETTVAVDLHQLIQSQAERFALSPHYLAAIVSIESSGRPCATSSKGAMGLGQLMPKTARGLGVVDAYQSDENLAGAALYLSRLVVRAGGDIRLAAAAYNHGPRALSKKTEQLPRETRDYLIKLDRFLARSEQQSWQQFLPKTLPHTNRRICRQGA